MSKEQLKMWFKIIGFFAVAILAIMFFVEILDTSGFVLDNFIKPVFFFIPLCIIVPAIILYIIYMFIDKGEMLKIIASILVCVLVFYVTLVFAISKRSDMINSYRYVELDSVSYQVVNGCFEDLTVERESRFRNPIHYSIGNMLVYESEYEDYNITENSDLNCSVNTYCADNYVLGYNRIAKSLKKYVNNIINRNYNCEVMANDIGSGELDGIKYNWSYGEFDVTGTAKYSTEFCVMLTYENSVYVIDVSISDTERTHIDMENKVTEIVEIVKSTDVFVDYN